MLTYREIEAAMAARGDEEVFYQGLYQACLDAFEQPIYSWQDFKGRFPGALPDKSPSTIKDVLTEEEFFANPDMQVNCFKNARYCPPFLHKLEFIKMVYILCGTSIFYINGDRYAMEEGNFCIVSPGIEQAMFTPDDSGLAVNILLRASGFMQTFSTILMEQGVLSSFFWRMAMTRYCNEVLYFKAQPDKRLSNIVLRIYDEVHLQKRPSSVIQESYVNILLGEMMRRHRGDLVKLQGLDEHVYQIPAILADMKQHLAEVTPAWLAAQWKMREEDMLAALKRETGHSFHYILNDLRMQRAAALLEGTTYSIEHIMEEIGVYDATSFYRHFRQRYNMTPQQYRQGRILP